MTNRMYMEHLSAPTKTYVESDRSLDPLRTQSILVGVPGLLLLMIGLAFLVRHSLGIAGIFLLTGAGLTVILVRLNGKLRRRKENNFITWAKDEYSLNLSANEAFTLMEEKKQVVIKGQAWVFQPAEDGFPYYGKGPKLGKVSYLGE